MEALDPPLDPIAVRQLDRVALPRGAGGRTRLDLNPCHPGGRHDDGRLAADDGRRPELPQRPLEPVAVPKRHRRSRWTGAPHGERAEFDAGDLLALQRYRGTIAAVNHQRSCRRARPHLTVDRSSIGRIDQLCLGRRKEEP